MAGKATVGALALLGIAVLFIVNLAAGAPSALHLALTKAEPAADATVRTPVSEISLFFTQAPQVRATGITLRNAAGQEVDVGDAVADEDDGKIVHVEVPTLAAGRYRVDWRAMASDGHIITGNYVFGVATASD